MAQKDGGYNPVNPPNPEVRLLHTLTATVEPVKAGYVSSSGNRYRTGDQVYVYSYNRAQFYRFKYWLEGDSVVSEYQSFYLTMPDRDVQLKAVYEYDPASPGQPYGMPGVLQLKSSPKNAGYFNYNNNQKIPVGTQLTVYAYERTNYKFKHWEYRGEIVSQNYWYDIVMPEGAMELVAVYEYDPVSPKNPGTNAWDQTTGELIIDDFNAGYLNSTIWNVTDGDVENIEKLIVAGRVTENDFGSMTEFPFKEVDFSRCAELTSVPSWTYEYNELLTTVSLPASITEIEWYAFYNCKSLTAVNLYATVPPTLETGAFEDIDKEQLIIYVPAASVDLYRSNERWSEFTIMPLQDQVIALQLNLPEGSDDGRYKNMFVELENTKSGQRIRYVITDRVAYTFQNLMRNSTWNAYVKNAAGQELGRIEGIELGNDDVTRTFESLLVPQTVKASVITPAGVDVTEQVQLTWLDTKGAYVGQGSSVSGILPLDSATLTLRITLPQEIAMQYLQPENYVYEVKSTDNTFTRTLEALPVAQLKGVVCDVLTRLPIDNATVTLSQTLNGRYSKSFTTKTASDGTYTFDAFDAPSSITAVAPEYVSNSLTCDTLMVSNGVAKMDSIGLKSINGATITVDFTYTLSALPGEQGETQAFFADPQNVAYTIRDLSAEKDIKEFNVQYPLIVLLEDVALGSQLQLTATSKTGAFKPVVATGTIDSTNRMNVTFNIKQLGQISATYVSTENKSVSAILYDDKGKFVQSALFADAAVSFTELEDGRYTLVAMGNSKLFNTIYDLYKFSQAGLVKGTDYATATVNVESGVISTVKVPFVPFFDETKLYYTGSNTSFAVNKAQVSAGSYLTLSARIDFKSMYANGVSNLELLVDLPESCSLVDQSIMVGNDLGDYQFVNNRVTIPFEKAGERIRFCIVPTAGGNYAPSAYVRFWYQGQMITQPIGQAAFVVKDLSINVPSTVAKLTIPVNGTAVGKSKVQVFDDGILIGETTALANGVWATTCELNATENPEHPIYAKVTTTNGLEMLSETKVVKYDADAIQMDNVTMYYTNPEVNGWRGQNYVLVYNFQNPSTTAYRYVYYIYNRTFTFTVELSTNDPEKVTRVILKVKTGDGKWHSLPTTFDVKKGKWFATAQFGDMYDGIVPVNVAVDFYVLVDGEEVLISCPTSGYPDNDVPIDPSGYVYEGVPTNRLEGVTASCYYKEIVEDQYGEKSEVVRLWDASEYAQENPLFTDEDGFYRWDVPQGLWQVKFEKEGYETTYSDWLPVPPPQLDVNIAMTQASEPEVKSVKAYEDGVEIEFDKYMKAEGLTTEHIYVITDDEEAPIVEGSIELLNGEEIEENASKLASRVKFALPEGNEWPSEKELTLVVSKAVRSYAGVALREDFAQGFDVEKKVRKMVADSLLTVLYEGTRTLQISALPAEAAKGKTLRVRILSDLIASASAEGLVKQEDGSALITLDENGQVELTITGELPGSTTLQFSIDDTNAEGTTIVKVEQAPSLVTAQPRASRASGSAVYRGTMINLVSDDDDANIWYTLDGSEPTTASTRYARPIVINQDEVTIKAIAQKEGYEESNVGTFEYSVKKNTQHLPLEGWTWISHNMNRNIDVNDFSNNTLEVKNQTKGVIRDANHGFFGNLTELIPTEAYKVKVADVENMMLEGDAFNAATGVINLQPGWNWVGYPMEQTMSLAEALANLTPSENDIIVGLSGSAEFINGHWIGDLDVLTPGQGYLMKVSNEVDLLYNTAIVSKAAQLKRGGLNVNRSPWSVDAHRYSDVMPMRVQLFRDGTQAEDDEYTVAAFVGTECRGIGKNVQGVIFMNVHGQGRENITFLACNNETENIVEINESMNFQTDNVGSFREPLALHLGAEADGVKEQYSKLGVWPAVAKKEITVSIGGRSIDRMTLTSTDGKMRRIHATGATQQTINVSNLPAGVYIVAVQSGNECFYKKIVKVNQ